MKKIMLFAAACVALAACSKDIDTTTPEIGDGSAFEKGQKVTLTVRTGDQTKVSSELVTSGTDKDKVNFKWETGDRIKVTVGTQSAEFTLSSGAGTATAEFTGSMPASGDNFNVQYPVDDPDLSSQTYVANGLPKDKMKMAATECTIAEGFTLKPQDAALRLNLYGLNREVSSIVVTNTTANPNVSYTLNCSTAVRVGNSEETATPFLLVVPAGGEWKFKVVVTAGNVTANPDPVPTYTEGSYTGDGVVITTGTTFSTSSPKTFTAAQILNMPAKSITTVWAPVNCGYDATNYKWGKLYQWGRKDGQGYDGNDATYPSGDNIATGPIPNIPTSSDVEKFYTTTDFHYNWYNGASPAPDALWGAIKTEYDPCPEGWRVPTMSELKALITTKIWTNIGGPSGNQTGYLFGTSPNQVFLPAAGCRGCTYGSAFNRGSSGSYWSSSVDGDDARTLRFHDLSAYMDYNYRADGCSVRCVQE